MKKLYAGLAAAALTATGIACTAGAAHAEGAPWALGYAPSDDTAVSTAISDTTIYTAALNADNTVDVTSTDRVSGATTHTVVSLAAKPGYTIGEFANNPSVAVTSTGLVLVSTDQGVQSDDGDVDDQGIWTAQVSSAATATATATETITGLDDSGTLAVSPNGEHAALTVGWELYTLSPSATTADAVELATTDDEDASASNVAVSNDGTVYAAGDDYPDGYGTSANPTLWTLASGSNTATSRALQHDAVSVAAAGSQALVGESYDTSDDSAYALQVFDGQTQNSVALPEDPYYLSVADTGTAVASDGWDLESVDLSKLDTYSDENPVPHGIVSSDIYGVDAVVATTDTVYAVTQPENADGSAGDATITRVTKPGRITNATQTVSSGEIDLSWTAPAQSGGADLSYVVTATDKATDKATAKVITVTTADTYKTLTTRDGLQGGHSYDVTVSATNGAFAGDAVTVPPVLPGSATVTVTGNATVGGALTATVSKSTFPAGTKLSYQWFYSGGEYGGAIDDETTAYKPTADHVGEQVGVIVTATKDGYSPASVRSNTVKVTAAQHAAAPAQLGSVKAKPIKAGAKKLKLKLTGVTTVPGKVKVYDGKKLLGKATVKNGKLTLKLKKHLAKGKHKLKLKYAGSAQVGKFNKAVKLKVK